MAENKNKLGKDFKEQTWYSNFLKKPIEKIQARLSFKRKSLKVLEKKHGIISENLKGMTVHMSNGRNNHEQFKLIEEIGFGTFGVVYSAKRLSDKKEVCSLYIPYSPKQKHVTVSEISCYRPKSNLIRKMSQICLCCFRAKGCC